MVDTIKYNEWFAMAKKDVRSAKILFEHDADYEIVCFHCQQAIEKYLKGYLIYETGELQEGHSLLKLCKKASPFNTNLKSFLKEMAFVNTYYIETRYPAIDPLIVSEEDASECLKIVESVMEEVEKSINVK